MINVELTDTILNFYKDIAKISSKTVEEVLQDTLNNTYELFLKHCDETDSSIKNK